MSQRRNTATASPKSPTRFTRNAFFAAAAAAGGDAAPGIAALVGRPLDEIERVFIGETLKLTGGNREQAAEMLGIGERTLYRKIKEYQLT